MTAPRVLILGGAGMLGHMLWRVFRDRFDTTVTLRGRVAEYAGLALFDPKRTIDGVNAFDFDSVAAACDATAPDVVVNGIGIVKQLKDAKDPIPSITINALFPHRLAALCDRIGARLVHVSTDCVFSGERGGYTESDRPDADDLYGRTKLLGEVTSGRALTVRTSIVGRELRSTTGLLEWLLSRRGGRVDGYTHAVFSGLTTRALAKVLADVIEQQPALAGLYHVASAPISKYDLLRDLDRAFGAGITIEPSDRVKIDRSLDGSRFAAATGLAVPTWKSMIREAADDSTPYEQWRTLGVS